MITVRLPTGQVLTFPDNTPESVIHAAAQEVLSGEADRKRQGQQPATSQTFDLSGLRSPAPAPGKPRTMPSGPGRDAHIGLATTGPAPTTADLPERSLEWWQSVSGSPEPKSEQWLRERQLRIAQESGQFGMAQLGFEDRETYYFNPTTGERVLKRHAVGNLPELDPQYRPRTPEEAARRRALGSVVDDLVHPADPEAVPELRRAVAAGVPGRVMQSEAGLLMPLQAAEAGVAGVLAEGRDILTGRLPERAGGAFRRAAGEAWRDSPITRGAAEIERNVVEPDRERLAEAARRAGLSPGASATLDTGQLVAGEVFNPGNWVGAEMLRSGAGVARRGMTGPGSALERAAELEARGGARTIDTGEGLVVREYGRGSALSEIEQGKVARSGEFSGAKEPLIYYDRTGGSPGWKGVVPDEIRRITGQPWRRYGGVTDLAEPTSPAPRPRNVTNRDPIPIAIEGGTPEQRERVLRLWDYASRRYPRIASKVPYIEIWSRKGGGASFDLASGRIALSPDSNLGALMHELGHAAQHARDVWPYSEAPTTRLGDVYSRLPEPRITTLKDIGSPVREPGSLHRLADDIDLGDDISSRFESFLDRNGITDPDTYYDMNPELRARLDAQFASEDTGPGTELWDRWLDSQGLEQRDYMSLSGLERARLENEYRMRAGELDEPSDAEFWRVEPEPRSDVLYDIPPSADIHVGTRVRAADRDNIGTIVGEDSSGRVLVRFVNKKDGTAATVPFDRSRLTITGARPRTVATTGSVQPPPMQQIPVSSLSDELAAERMGWKTPDYPPRATQTASMQSGFPERGSIDPITTPEGQTNIAAQVDPVHGYFGDPEVAGYVIENSDRVFAQQGPPQTWATLEEMAMRRGLTTEELLRDQTHWNVMPPEVRLRTLYVIKGKEQIRADLQAKLAAGTATDADKAELLRTIEVIGDLTALGAKSGSAYGRALNSLKMEARLALSDSQMLRQKIYQKYADQIDANRDILDALARLNPNNPEEMMTFQRLVERPKFREYLQEYWVSSVLSGPATHERNFIGNTVNAVMENAFVRPIAAGFDAARVGGTDLPREIFLRETPEAIVGLTRGIREGARRGLEVLRRGYPVNTHGNVSAGKLFPVRSAFARSQNKVVREVVGPIVTMPLRLLSASDELFKTMNYTAELYAQAARIAKKEMIAERAGIAAQSMVPSSASFADRVARLVQNPTDDMVQAADAFALKATFNDDVSALGQGIMRLRDIPQINPTSTIGKATVEAYRTFGGFIIPFVRIADRLMVRGFEYTPIGAIKSMGARQADNMIEASDLAARSAIGSVILAYAASLAVEGRLTAGAPTDERERAAFFAAGKQPWSVRTENGTWIPYGGLQPIGTPFALVASAHKGWKENGDEPSAERLGSAAAKIGQYVTDQSYMQGLSDFFDAIQGDARSGAASDLATGIVGGFAPYSGLQRSISQAIDPRVIDAKTIPDRLKRNIPGVSRSMPGKLTPWGEEAIPVGGRLRSVLAPGSVLLPSRENEDPLDKELQRLDMPLGTVGKSLSDKLPKRLSGDGEADSDWLDRELHRLGMPLGYVGKQISGAYGNGRSRGTWKLDDEEWYTYQQTAGRATRKVLERLFARGDYAGWDTEKQRQETERAIGAAREYARLWAVRYHRGSRPRTMNGD